MADGQMHVLLPDAAAERGRRAPLLLRRSHVNKACAIAMTEYVLASVFYAAAADGWIDEESTLAFLAPVARAQEAASVTTLCLPRISCAAILNDAAI
nr:hypothetical protein [Oryza sativa Japonica Group]BAD03598.1 hypothetical protein [Oryza sativa Japonica Group]